MFECHASWLRGIQSSPTWTWVQTTREWRVSKDIHAKDREFDQIQSTKFYCLPQVSRAQTQRINTYHTHAQHIHKMASDPPYRYKAKDKQVSYSQAQRIHKMASDPP